MKVTIGGDRIGAGKKQKQYLNNYNRSTHNLSQTWTSPMTPGALYPFLVIPAMRGDKFEIKTIADCITIPTVGPLFGSFKLQLDIFSCPVRLYQALLHNNPLAIGLKANQVLMPVINQYTMIAPADKTNESGKLNESCLLKYLGVSGIGQGYTDVDSITYNRNFNGVPLLAYYDIFKNYYANKQEENAYIIGGKKEEVRKIECNDIEWTDNEETTHQEVPDSDEELENTWQQFDVEYETIIGEETISTNVNDIKKYMFITLMNNYEDDIVTRMPIEEVERLSQGVTFTYDTGKLTIKRQTNADWRIKGQVVKYYNFGIEYIVTKTTSLELKPFKLKNIDDMRMDILSFHTLGSAFNINGVQHNYLPYNQNTYENNQFPLNGLVVKTYQNDLFNNWINTEWIDGENGIAEITKLSTDNGITIDALNLSEKLYNMLNRVALAGNTYEDWQDVIWEETKRRHIESPIYCGGMSSEIVFEQIVQSAPADGDPLGTLAGRGRHVKRKGGYCVIKVDEPTFIIGIASLTPRIKYTQGNEFYMTEIKSIDDLHKPALDQIGFQNLLGERMAWWDTELNADGTIKSRSIIGKVPAWMEYMTAVDKAFGDFANTKTDENGKPLGLGYMILNRNYERSEDDEIKDATTYIDPTKYNYAFAYSALDAQNFWTEIYSHIKARRLMSAKQIPNV